MTDIERLTLLRALLKQHTKASLVSKKVARQTLIDEGIYTKGGKLTAEYGGTTKKVKTAA